VKSAIYPGSFDPVTLGHLDIIKRAAAIFGHLTVAVMHNGEKNPHFTPEERADLIRQSTAGLPVTVLTSDKLLVDFAAEHKCEVIVKGLRAISDFEREFQMALTNRKLNPALDTLFLNTSLEYLYLSSSMVKEIVRKGGDITPFVPAEIVKAVTERLTR
jgi:pantetheine-phosphate adenylyltransferase